jgi:uncharacterized repeat protein (TIGR01451 family)
VQSWWSIVRACTLRLGGRGARASVRHFVRAKARHDVVDRLQCRRQFPTVCWAAIAVVVLSLAWTTASASASAVSGRVFNDFNTNGLFDTDQNRGAVDVGVGGLTVQAFTGTDTLVGTAVTGADGRYTLNVPDAKVRLELSVVLPWWPTRQLNGLRSDVQFVDASSAQTGVNFGVHRLSEFSIDNPILFWPTQWAGPPVASNPNSTQIAIRGAPYFSKQPPGSVQTWDQLATKVSRATFEQVGTVFGLAMDQATRDLYAGAYQKRLAGLKNGPGAIFKITPQRDVSLFAQVPDAGSDPHPTSPNINDWVTCGSANANTPSTLDHCDFSWTDVGKIGLGSVVIDPEDQNLYTVNLNDKKLYRFELNAGSAPARRKRHARAAAVEPAAAITIPNPQCGAGTALSSATNWRPFAAEFDRVNERLYVGGVCSAETTQDRALLRAVIYRVDNPLSAAPSFVKVLDFPLNYARAPSPATSGIPGALTGTLGWCGANTSSASGGYCRWNPWPTTTSTGGYAPSNSRFGTENNNPSFPQLTAITFAEDGSMILGFRDLMGDMGGVNVPGEIGDGSAAGLGPMLHGDMLRAGAEANGDFTLEANGRVAGITSAGQGTFANTRTNWGYGPGIGLGTPGGYFYNPAPLATPQPQPTSSGETYFNIPHPYQGGLTQIPGFLDVVATSIHIRDTNANGLLWRDNTTGATKGGLQNYQTLDVHSFTGFAKSNGLGDVDAFTGLAPVQIGNRLWYDLNRNGIQDADEPPVTDTVVELVDSNGRVVDSTRTDAQGEYVFAIDAGTSYRVRVPLDQPSLEGWVPTQPFLGDQRRLDSNGRVVDGRSVAFVRPHGTGRNDHSYDFGFHRPPPAPPPEPQPPVPEPPPPPAPPAAGVLPETAASSRPLVLVKHLVSRSGGNLRFAMVVRNSAPDDVSRVHVCDRLSARLGFVSATPSGRRVVGRLVCWSFASLSSGEQRTLNLTTRLRAPVPRAGMINCAIATARNVPAQRACATVRGARQPAFTG